MDTQKVAAKYRLSQWAQIFQARQESGQNIKEFCESTGISRNTYFYWQRKLRASTCAELSKSDQPNGNTPNGWLELIAEPTRSGKAELAIEINGCHILVSQDTDLNLLQKICHILRPL